ncbi:MAG: hypothetical protein GBAus27B_000504 [Mycoplasmataceae bacterium]|nr:MAG: hypothetical protein GBAus27B_000504 [Mycoplasmataceae bacterium]
MCENTKFWIEMAIIALWVPFIKAIVTIFLGRYFLKYTDKEVAKLEEKLENKEKRSEERIKKVEEGSLKYREFLEKSHALNDEILKLATKIKEDWKKNVEFEEGYRKWIKETFKEKACYNCWEIYKFVIGDEKNKENLERDNKKRRK